MTKLEIVCVSQLVTYLFIYLLTYLICDSDDKIDISFGVLSA